MKNTHGLFTPVSLFFFILTIPSCADDGLISDEDIGYDIDIIQQMIDDGPVDPQQGEIAVFEVRLRHATTGKCIYGNPTPGGLIHNWVCWDDPNMVYKLFPVGGTGDHFLVHKNTSHYIDSSYVDGAAITNRPGYNPYGSLRYHLDDAGGGKVRLRSVATGKCLYGTNTNGGTIGSWICWNDPNMEFYLDPV